ncbi:hypothetical protein ABIF99_006830 [Bradyrhizobium japonicum]|nr:hypothetical protein [Bradyrhizobium japonicum]MCP1859145.1 hypothetical protein [Bradyrhizobium japonicum]MCP1889960.1 hypothetical protein [Bradyrhizobium japonicum]MCW2322943.1 hypothetical protein [Bradyrhizobium japonicum]
MPTSASSSATRALMSALAQPAISSGSAMLSAAVRDDSRLKCWKIIPIERCASRNSRPASAEISLLSTITRPVVGFSSPLISRTRLDLPAPERPMTPVIEPRAIAKSMSCSALTPGLPR